MKALTKIVLGSALAVLAGCGGTGSSGVSASSKGGIALRIVWPQPSRLIPVAANSIVLDVTAREVASGNEVTVRHQVVPRPQPPATTTTVQLAELPVGALLVHAEAHPNADGTGNAQAKGIAAMQVEPGKTTDLSLTMDSTITSVTVAPDPVAVSAGANQTVTVTAKDADGAVVLVNGSQAQWSVANTSVATISASGLTATVHGVATGTTDLSVVLHDGSWSMSGAGKVNVQSSGYHLAGQWTSDLFTADSAQGVAYSNGYVYAAAPDGTPGGKIVKFDLNGQVVGSWNAPQPQGLAVMPNGDILVTSHSYYAGTPRLNEYKPDGTVVRSFDAQQVQLPSGVAVASDGTIYVQDEFGPLKKLAADGSYVGTIGDSERHVFWNVATANGFVYTTDYNSENPTRILKYDLNGNLVKVFSITTTDGIPYALAADPQGRIFEGGSGGLNIVDQNDTLTHYVAGLGKFIAVDTAGVIYGSVGRTIRLLAP